MARTSASLLSLFLVATPLFAQEEQKKPNPPEKPEGEPGEKSGPSATEGYDEYLTITDVKYLSPAQGASGQGLELKFDISPDIPKGCVIRLTLEKYGDPRDETTYTFKDDSNRKGLTFTWKFSKKIVTGEYGMRTHIDIDKQILAVQRAFRDNAKKFPPKSAPWSWRCKPEINVGTKEDEEKDRDEICAACTQFMDRVIDQMTEFKETMDKALNNEDLAEGGSLDKTKFEAYVKEWRGKQGALQKEIREFLSKDPGLVQKSPAAFRLLQEFGRMASKRSLQLQKEVADKFKAADVNPTLKDFDKSYKGRVDAKGMQSTYDNIRQLAGCKEEAEEEAGAEAAAPDGSAPPGDEVKDPPPQGDGDGQKAPDSPPGKDGKDAKGKAKDDAGKKGADKKETGKKDAGKKA